MILTGKAREDFFQHIFDNITSTYFGDMIDVLDYVNGLEECSLNALIVEWFETIGWLEPNINIQVLLWLEYSTHNDGYIDDKNIRAIIKANEIYNSRC